MPSNLVVYNKSDWNISCKQIEGKHGHLSIVQCNKPETEQILQLALHLLLLDNQLEVYQGQTPL